MKDWLEWMPLALVGIGILFGVILYRFQIDNNTHADFDLSDLVMQNGRVDKFAFWFAVVIVMLTWMMIYLVLHDKLTPEYLTIYVGAVVAPLVAKVIWGKRLDVPMSGPESK